KLVESRRRNFTDEGLALLRQALRDRPFLQPRGSIPAGWDALAATLVADDSFPRENLSGNTASGRFDKLINAYRDHDADAATLSGEESEKVVLLDELIALIDDHAARTVASKATGGLKRQREEKASLAARQYNIPPKRRREAELKNLLISLKEKEIVDKKAEREELAMQHAREREEDKIKRTKQRLSDSIAFY
ncbi:hypothetical protein GN958_ATG13251, partial [Phytophthora infestans]